MHKTQARLEKGGTASCDVMESDKLNRSCGLVGQNEPNYVILLKLLIELTQTA